MYNKKALNVDLGKFTKPDPYKDDILYTEQGQWEFPGQPTRIPSNDITMEGVPYPVYGIDNTGYEQMMYPGEDYTFPGDYVDEYPMAKRGGYMQSLPKKKSSKRYSRSLTATNKLFTKNPLFKNTRVKKNRIFDPNAKYYQDGGIQIEGYNEDSPWLGEQYKDLGATLTAGRFNVSAGNYFPTRVQEPTSNFNPYINLGVDLNKDRNLSFEYSPGYAGVTFTKSFEKGGFNDDIDKRRQVLRDWTYGKSIGMLQEPDGGYLELDLSNEEIEEYRKGGYIVEDISIPTLTKAEYGMPMGTGISQNYMGSRRTLYQTGGLMYDKQYAAGGAASPTDLNPATMKKYKQDLKTQENSIKAGYNKAQDKWYPHGSPEGGNPTIGYGHKLTDAEISKYNKGVTSGQIEELLTSDILKHQTIAENMIDKKYGKGTFDRLPQTSQMLLVDYAYNGVLGKFPTFTDAVVKRNKNLMLKEYERGSSAGKLTERNNWTRNIIENNYQEGGPIELELTPEEIDWYISQGYEIEDLD